MLHIQNAEMPVLEEIRRVPAEEPTNVPDTLTRFSRAVPGGGLHIMPDHPTEDTMIRDSRNSTIILDSDALKTLKKSYSEALYHIDTSAGRITLRTDEKWDIHEKILPYNEFIYITAWNPGSLSYSDSLNRENNSLLLSELNSCSSFILFGYSESPSGEWREESFFAGDCSLEIGKTLQKQFGQNAFLYGKKGQRVELIF